MVSSSVQQQYFRPVKPRDITREVARAKAHPSAVLTKPSDKQVQIAGQVVPYVCKNTDYKRNYLIFSDKESFSMEQLPETMQAKGIDPVTQFGVLQLCTQTIHSQRGENPARLPVTFEKVISRAKSPNQQLQTVAGLAALEKDPKKLPQILMGKTAAPAPQIGHVRPELKLYDHLRYKGRTEKTAASYSAQKEVRPETIVAQADKLLAGALKNEGVDPKIIRHGLRQNDLLWNKGTA